MLCRTCHYELLFQWKWHCDEKLSKNNNNYFLLLHCAPNSVLSQVETIFAPFEAFVFFLLSFHSDIYKLLIFFLQQIIEEYT